MNIAQALKEKARLIGEIEILKAKTYREASESFESFQVPESSAFVPAREGVAERFDNNQKALLGKIEKLSNLKVMIATANIPIIPKLIALSEAKSFKSWADSLPRNSKPKVSKYDDSYTFHVWGLTDDQAAQISVGIQESINALQDEIDVFNANTFI